jgi:acetyl-CoA acetyltransferase
MNIGERAAVISGIGQSAIGRNLNRSPLSLTVDAALEALEDAGLTPADIDGVATWPGAAAATPGFSSVGVWNIKEALDLELRWFSGGSEAAGQLGGVFAACAAIAAGLATHVLCFRTVWESTAQSPQRRASLVGGGHSRISGEYQWHVPFGAQSAANWVAMMAMRHFHEFGTTREQLATIALNERANAARNPKAIFREPLTMDDYLAARMISDPLGLYDCDIPIDGSTAVVVSARETARELRGSPVKVEAIGCGLRGRPSWDQFDDLTTMAARDAAAMLWSRTDLKPRDVDIAELYDGFSFLTIVWLEALGFCPKGEGGRFIEGGKRIALDGELPLNTNGGQLSAGRLHGYGFLHEACTQLRSAAGDRQVPGSPEVAVVGVGGGPLGGCVLLTR